MKTSTFLPGKESHLVEKPHTGQGSIRPANELQQQCPFDDDWQLINQILDEGIGPPEKNLAINGYNFNLFLLTFRFA